MGVSPIEVLVVSKKIEMKKVKNEDHTNV